MPTLPPPARAAARRAQWLAELRSALDDANRLALRLRALDPAASETALLHMRIVALKAEIDLLQRARPGLPDKIPPKRIE